MGVFFLDVMDGEFGGDCCGSEAYRLFLQARGFYRCRINKICSYSEILCNIMQIQYYAEIMYLSRTPKFCS